MQELFYMLKSLVIVALKEMDIPQRNRVFECFSLLNFRISIWIRIGLDLLPVVVE